MGFIGGGLDSEPYDRQYADRELVQRILHYFAPQRRHMLYSALAIFFNSALDAGIPILVAAIVDQVAGRLGAGLTVALPLGVLLLASSTWLTNYVRHRNAAFAVGNVVMDLQAEAFAATAHHDLSFFDEEPSGKIVSRITSDTQAFGETAVLTMNLISEVLSVAIIAGVLLSINVRLTLVMLAMSPVVFGTPCRSATRAPLTLNARRVLAKVNANIQESVSGIAVGKGSARKRGCTRSLAP